MYVCVCVCVYMCVCVHMDGPSKVQHLSSPQIFKMTMHVFNEFEGDSLYPGGSGNR